MMMIMVLLFMTVRSLCLAQEFVMSPESLNATLRSTVTFVCHTNSSTGSENHFWKINEQFADFTSIHQHGNTSELEVFCSEDLDMANITCVLSVVNGTSIIDIFSDPALLRIQGLLDPIVNLSINSTTTSIILTWVPPFSLDITGVEPDFTHTVEVYNITSSGETQQVGVYENITNSTFTFALCELCCERQSTFTDASSSLFEFTVIAVNAVGRGEPSEPVQGRYMEAPDQYSTTSSYGITVTMETSTTDVFRLTLPATNSTDIHQPHTVAGTINIAISFVVGVIVGSVTTLIIVLIVVCIKRHSKVIVEKSSTTSGHQSDEEIEMKSCDAYDVTATKQVKNKPPPPSPAVYEEVDL